MAPFPMAKSDVISQLHVEKFPIAFENHFFKAITKSKTSQRERTLNFEDHCKFKRNYQFVLHFKNVQFFPNSPE